MHGPDASDDAGASRAASPGGDVVSAFEQLRRTRQRIDGILQVVVGDDGVLVQDFTGRIAYANAPAALMLGAASPEALLRTPQEELLGALVIRDEAGSDVSGELPGTAVLRGGEGGERVLRMSAAPGGERWVRVRTAPMRDDRGLVASVVTVLRDETGTRRAAEFRDNLLGIASHDLRGPLSAIVMGASAVAQRAHTLDPNIAKLMGLIQSSAEKAGRMVHDLLDLTQARLGGGIPVTRRESSAEQLLKEVIDELAAIHHGRAIVARCTTRARTVCWDPDRVSQVIANLVNNAITYGDPGTPVTVTVADAQAQAQEGRAQTQERVAISVHNHGPEIASSNLESMFEPYTRGSAAGRHQRSVGLGLYIVKEIVAAHGGVVSATSSRQEGTCFTVLLPVG
ncbi:HAMP domain-containing sensor histidine kinase [Ramlibacter sp. AN1015]|uniref:PAS domain-containing sensor histidine kinase n=1 Tax=Ramlibacter sp. AN1015 TaxID=3133428 RepID=UPI0030BC2C97